ncbi:MAG TPA: (d)CMP kinase [Legionella sp.]|nr:(d)CMP kinase [Legionella sp.]
MNNNVPVITIDGPSGTGKGTICHLLARHLNWNILDSGAIYRVLAYAAQKNQVNVEEHQKLVELALGLNLQFESSNDNELIVLLDNENISEVIRSEQCGQDASKIAAISEVRLALLERQRNFAELPGLVTDGRDMGTIVFPNAVLKIFLYASEEERANRRYLQLKQRQINVSLAQVVEDLANRDARDSARTHSPLKPAEDAINIDTTGLSIVQVFHTILNLVDEHLKN